MAIVKRRDLIRMIVQKTGLPKKVVEDAINDCFDVFREAIQRGDTVVFRGIGKFYRRQRKCRKPHGFNGKTGRVAKVWNVKFQAAENLKGNVQ